MSPHVFRKQFRSPDAAATAVLHHTWLTSLGSDLWFPAVLRRHGRVVEFEHVAGPTAGLADLTLVARALGQLHYAARHDWLDGANVNRPFPLGKGGALTGFADPRRDRLHAALSTVSGPLSGPLVDAWLDAASGLPAALYKDANPRNVILSRSRGPVLIDFDTLTLAPVGYDLAKLIVTTVMTFGSLPRQHVLDALHAYTTALDIDSSACPLSHIQVWAEFHHMLTRPWLGRHYRYDWLRVRPWTVDEITTAAHAPARS